MQQHIEDFIRFQESLGRNQKQSHQQELKLKKFKEYLYSHYLINDPQTLTFSVTREYGIYLSQCKTAKGLPYKPAYQNQHRLTVRAFLKYLKRYELLEALPLVKEPQLLPTSVLSHEEALKLLNSIDTSSATGYRDRAILELLYSSGLRVSELSGLNTDDINLKERTAKVLGKGQKERMVVFGETASKYIENYLKAVRPFAKGQNSEALFLGIRGQRLGIKGIEVRVKEYAEPLGLENITPHTFRRSCTTELVRANANLYHVKELLGHANLNTLKAYTKLSISDLKKTLKEFHPREKKDSP